MQVLSTVFENRVTLGQLTGPDTAAVPGLPPAPFYEDWILVNPVPLTVILGAMGVIIALILLKGGKLKPGLIVASAGVVGGVLVMLAGSSVTTPREVLMDRTGELVQATASADAALMRELLHTDVALKPGSVRFIPEITGRERMLGLAGNRIPQAVGRVVVLETRAGLDGPRVGRTQVRLRTFGTDGQLYGHSWWGLDWRKHDGEWTAVGIEPLWIQDPS